MNLTDALRWRIRIAEAIALHGDTDDARRARARLERYRRQIEASPPDEPEPTYPEDEVTC
jgi:hypothetical protein